MIRDRILSLEKDGQLLNPTSEIREEWTERVIKFAFSFIDSLDTGKAFHKIHSLKGKLTLDDSNIGINSLEAELTNLQINMIDQGLNPASGGHLGYIPGGGIYSGALGDYIAAITDQYAGIFYGGPGAVKIENELIRWMCRMIGFPEGSLGNLSSGGSIANLIAIVTAREAKQIKSAQIPECCIYLTGQVHHCVHKAIRISGLMEAHIREIAIDSKFRMSAKALEEQIILDLKNGLRPFLVVASAGTTDTGSIDPINEIADIAEKYGLWYHIDAAYGGFFILADIEDVETSILKNKFLGIERADSVAIDPHKGLFLSYGLGAVLIKDVNSQFAAHYYRAAYMQDTLNNQEELSPADLSPELTKHFRGLRMWLPLKLHGIGTFKACLEEKIMLCRYFYEEVQKLGFQVGPYPDLSVCIYRYIPQSGDSNSFNARIVDRILQNGRLFVSSTNINGIFWIRIAILNFRTHLSLIDEYLNLLKKIIENESEIINK